MFPVKSININPPELMILFFAASRDKIGDLRLLMPNKVTSLTTQPYSSWREDLAHGFFMGPPKFWRSHK